MSILINILLAINLIVALLIILITLMQRPKQEGLGAAFGGGMTENMFGAQTTNVLQSVTRWLGAIFFVITLAISALYARHGSKKGLLNPDMLEKKMAPAATLAPSKEGTEAKEEAKAAPEATAHVAPEATPAAPATPESAPEATATPSAAAPETPAAAPAEAAEAETPAAPEAAVETAPETPVEESDATAQPVATEATEEAPAAQ